MGYFSTWTERGEYGLRLLAPYSLMAVLFIFNAISFSYPVTGTLKAPLLIMAIYYWSIYRPTLIPPWLVFAAGLMLDIVSGMPPGLNALVLVLIRWSVTDQRRFLMGQSFLMIWIAFLLISIAAGFVQWLVFGLVNANWPPAQPIGFSILLGLALYPVISILLHFTHKLLPEPRGNFMLKTKRRQGNNFS